MSSGIEMANEGEIFERLSLVESETASIKSTINRHGDMLTDHGTKLDAIITAVTRAEARPQVDWWKIIGAVSAIITATAVIMGGLVYLIILLTAKDAEINRKLIGSQTIIMNERKAFNDYKHSMNERELLRLRKRVHELEIRSGRFRLYGRS